MSLKNDICTKGILKKDQTRAENLNLMPRLHCSLQKSLWSFSYQDNSLQRESQDLSQTEVLIQGLLCPEENINHTITVNQDHVVFT